MNLLQKRIEWMGPALLLALLTAVAFWARPMTPIDETRYISVAWEMWLRDEYLVLFKNGEPYSHKPPLLFWLYNLGWAVFGINEWWPRLVSPLFSLGGLLLTLSIARRLWPEDVGAHRHALWILASSLLWMVFSTSAMFDVMLAFFVLLGMRGLLIAAHESMRRGFVWLSVSIGLGVLAKGPVILLHLLPVAVLAFWWKPNLNWKRWYGAILLAVLGGAMVALAWAIPAAIHGGEEYRNAIFWGQTANRMVDSFAHKRPFWWYLPLLPLLLFPWLLWPGLWRRILSIKRDEPDTGLRFCLAWMLPVFIAFSFISGKQIHYLVPLFPAFALLAGRRLVTGNSGSIALPASVTALVGVTMTYFAVAGLPDPLSIWGAMPRWPGLALLIASIMLFWMSRRAVWKVPAMAGLGAVLLVLVQSYISSGVGPAYDVHPIAREINRLQQRGLPIANAARYHAQFQFAGRLQKPLAEVSVNKLEAWFVQHPQGVAVMYFSRDRTPAEALFSQPYRGETAALLNAAQFAKSGAHLVQRARKKVITPADAEDEE